LPRLNQLYNALRAKGLEVVAISVMQKHDDLIRYARASGFRFPIAAADKPELSIEPLRKLYGTPGPMTTFVIDHTGRIVFRDYDSDYVELRAELAKLGLR
jgi:peroxiredoxin